jgi:long-chain acyl-CoA synthetase
MSRIRVAYTAGEAIGPDLFRFYRSIGINLKQFYGQTETCAYVCLQPDGQVKFDTVGRPRQAWRSASPTTARCWCAAWGCSRTTTSARRHRRGDQRRGYFMTGDAGVIDADGHLKIIDRAKDVGKLADGAMFAPNYIENKLKFFPHIKEAVAFGTDRDRVCAFINIDFDAVGNWAERRHLPMRATSTWPPSPT